MIDHRTVGLRAPLTRRSFLKSSAMGAAALSVAGSGAFAGSAQASDWSGETLRFMIINPHAGSIKPLSEGFNELTGATVEGVKVPYDQITAQSTLDVMSGTNEMDVFQYWYVDKEALVRDGVLADITDRIAAEEADIDPADFLGALYDAYTLVDGRRYGLPYDGDTHVLFYNKEILDRERPAAAGHVGRVQRGCQGGDGCGSRQRRLRRPADVQAVPDHPLLDLREPAGRLRRRLPRCQRRAGTHQRCCDRRCADDARGRPLRGPDAAGDRVR